MNSTFFDDAEAIEKEIPRGPVSNLNEFKSCNICLKLVEPKGYHNHLLRHTREAQKQMEDRKRKLEGLIGQYVMLSELTNDKAKIQKQLVKNFSSDGTLAIACEGLNEALHNQDDKIEQLKMEDRAFVYEKSSAMSAVLKGISGQSDDHPDIKSENLSLFRDQILLRCQIRELEDNPEAKKYREVKSCLNLRVPSAEAPAAVSSAASSSESAGGILPAASAAVSSVFSFATGGSNVKKA